ncbi:MAG: glycosyltransferase family 39 protein, partial [Magnetococcales bacterium]|nr:glycosyltransferase family 39 protein [Magnetococcales bacterium]
MNPRLNPRHFPAMVLIGVVGLGGGLLAGNALMGELAVIRTALQLTSYHFFSTNLTLLLVALLFHGEELGRAVRGADPRLLGQLAAITLAGFLLVGFVAPEVHRIYYDETIYENIGQSLAVEHRAEMCNEGEVAYGVYRCQRGEYNKQPNGFPYLLAVAFQIFGTDEAVAHWVNCLAFTLSIPVLFLIGALGFGHPRAGLFAALVQALTPENLLWGHTTSAETSAALMGALMAVNSSPPRRARVSEWRMR